MVKKTKVDTRQIRSNVTHDKITFKGKDLNDVIGSINTELTLPLDIKVDTNGRALLINALKVSNSETDRTRMAYPDKGREADFTSGKVKLPTTINGSITAEATVNGTTTQTNKSALNSYFTLGSEQYIKVQVIYESDGTLDLSFGSISNNAGESILEDRKDAIGYFEISSTAAGNINLISDDDVVVFQSIDPGIEIQFNGQALTKRSIINFVDPTLSSFSVIDTGSRIEVSGGGGGGGSSTIVDAKGNVCIELTAQVSTFTLQDTNGVNWEVTASETGELIAESGSLNAPVNISLVDDGGTTRQLKIDINGNIFTDSTTAISPLDSLAITDDDLNIWYIRMHDDGIIYTIDCQNATETANIIDGALTMYTLTANIPGTAANAYDFTADGITNTVADLEIGDDGIFFTADPASGPGQIVQGGLYDSTHPTWVSGVDNVYAESNITSTNVVVFTITNPSAYLGEDGNNQPVTVNVGDTVQDVIDNHPDLNLVATISGVAVSTEEASNCIMENDGVFYPGETVDGTEPNAGAEGGQDVTGIDEVLATVSIQTKPIATGRTVRFIADVASPNDIDIMSDGLNLTVALTENLWGVTGYEADGVTPFANPTDIIPAGTWTATGGSVLASATADINLPAIPATNLTFTADVAGSLGNLITIDVNAGDTIQDVLDNYDVSVSYSLPVTINTPLTAGSYPLTGGDDVGPVAADVDIVTVAVSAETVTLIHDVAGSANNGIDVGVYADGVNSISDIIAALGGTYTVVDSNNAPLSDELRVPATIGAATLYTANGADELFAEVSIGTVDTELAEFVWNVPGSGATVNGNVITVNAADDIDQLLINYPDLLQTTAFAGNTVLEETGTYTLGGGVTRVDATLDLLGKSYYTLTTNTAGTAGNSLSFLADGLIDTVQDMMVATNSTTIKTASVDNGGIDIVGALGRVLDAGTFDFGSGNDITGNPVRAGVDEVYAQFQAQATASPLGTLQFNSILPGNMGNTPDGSSFISDGTQTVQELLDFFNNDVWVVNVDTDESLSDIPDSSGISTSSYLSPGTYRLEGGLDCSSSRVGFCDNTGKPVQMWFRDSSNNVYESLNYYDSWDDLPEDPSLVSGGIGVSWFKNDLGTYQQTFFNPDTREWSGGPNTPDMVDSGMLADVVTSMLTEAQFQTLRGSKWVLADGRSVTGSDYHSLTGKTSIPDMRGQFLRGKNNGRNDGNENPDGDLNLGEFQTDEVGPHVHEYLDYYLRKSPDANYGNVNDEGQLRADTRDTEANDGLETRPKNITVNYFIKINR